MRSTLPKVLHELCGRPMVLWPVSAALEAGASRVVVVDSPNRQLERVLPEGVELAVQEQSNGTGGAVIAAVSHLDEGPPAGLESASADGLDAEAPVVVLSGDVPMVSAEAIRGLLEAHEQSGAAATMVTTILDDPSGYGRVVRDAAGAVERVVETKEHRDSTPEERKIGEVNAGIYVFDAHALRQVLPTLSADNAQGSCTCRRCLTCSGCKEGRSPPTSSMTRGLCWASTTGRRSRACHSSRRKRSTSDSCARA